MKIKNYVKLSTLLLLFAFVGCQKENVIKLEASAKEDVEVVQTNSNSPKYIKGDEIQDILGHLASKTNKTYSKIGDLNGKIDYNKAKILINHAMEVFNEGKNTNYSFDLFLDDMPEYEFYSLIVSKTEDGVIEEPYIIGYTMTKEDYENYIAHELDFKHFRATQRFYTFDSFFADTAKGMTGRSGDCGSQTIGSGGTGNGGGGGGSHTAPGETFTSNYSETMLNSNFGLRQTSHLWVYEQEINTPSGSSSATTTTNSTSVTATGTIYAGPLITIAPPIRITSEEWVRLAIYLENKNSGSSPNTCYSITKMLDGGFSIDFFDCPPSVQQKMGTTAKGSGTLSDCFVISGGVAINVTLLAVDINRKLSGALNDDQLAFLTENQDKTLQIFKFLGINDSPDDQIFVYKAIEALRKGGKVDFEDKIINELDENSIEACLHKKMKESGGDNLISGVMNWFKGDTEFSITIKSEDEIYSRKLRKFVNGETRFVSNTKNIEIAISTTNSKNRSSIEVVRTILHEYIHADILRKVYTSYNYSFIEEFKTVYNDYQNDIYNLNPDPDHETMADYYVDKMSFALKEFHKSSLKNDYDKFVTYYGEEPNSYFYKALAWRGIRNAGVDAWKNLSREEREKIEKEDVKIDLLTKGCN